MKKSYFVVVYPPRDPPHGGGMIEEILYFVTAEALLKWMANHPPGGNLDSKDAHSYTVFEATCLVDWS